MRKSWDWYDPVIPEALLNGIFAILKSSLTYQTIEMSYFKVVIHLLERIADAEFFGHS